MARKRSRKHKEFDDATGVTDEDVKAEFAPEPEVETTPESDAVARKMLADAPARAAEIDRKAVLEARATTQRKLSTEERLDQLEKATGLSPVVEE